MASDRQAATSSFAYYTAICVALLTLCRTKDVTLVGELNTTTTRAKLVVYDIFAGLGVLHIIDAVIVPNAPKDIIKNVYDTLKANGCNKFAKALDTLGIAGPASSPFLTSTWFAPTDKVCGRCGI